MKIQTSILLSLMLLYPINTCPNDPYCVRCNKDKCEQCVFSYNDNGKCIQPKTLIENCTHYRSENECSFCKKKFGVLENKCVAIEVKNCSYSISPKFCQICSQGYSLTVDDYENCTKKKVIKNCEGQTIDDLGNTFCAECEQGYSVNFFKRCSEEPEKNCAVTDLMNTACKECKLGYYFSENKCIASKQVQELLRQYNITFNSLEILRNLFQITSIFIWIFQC